MLTVPGAGTVREGERFEKFFRLLRVLRGQVKAPGDALYDLSRRVAPDNFGEFLAAQEERFHQLELSRREAQNVESRPA